MKLSLLITLSLLFAAISIYLSLVTKNQRVELAQTKTINARLGKEKEQAQSNAAMAIEAFVTTFNVKPAALSKSLAFSVEPKGTFLLLYLKAHACSSCNNHAYIELIERLKDNPKLSHCGSPHQPILRAPVACRSSTPRGGYCNLHRWQLTRTGVFAPRRGVIASQLQRASNLGRGR